MSKEHNWKATGYVLSSLGGWYSKLYPKTCTKCYALVDCSGEIVIGTENCPIEDAKPAHFSYKNVSTEAKIL